jgi:hypothetical protein
MLKWRVPKYLAQTGIVETGFANMAPTAVIHTTDKKGENKTANAGMKWFF